MQQFDLNSTLDRVREALDRDNVAAAIHILEKLKQTDQVEVIDELDPEDSADIISELEPADQATLIKELDPEDSADIISELEPHEQDKLISELDPEDSADIISELEPDEQATLMKRLKPEDSADIMAEMDEDEQADIAERVDDAALSRILDEMEPDDAADVIGDLPESRKANVLAHMEEADDVRPLLIHPDESAGGLMTTSFMTLRPLMTAQDAIGAMRDWHPDDEMPYYLFVVNRDRQLVGIVSLRQLITALPDKLVGDIMKKDVISVPVGTDQEECAQLFRKYNFLALPVVDAENRLLGVITSDDLIDVIEEEATEDALRLAGVNDEESVWSSVPESLRWRVPWLVVNLATAFLAGWVSSLFDKTIAVLPIFGALQTIVAGQGGVAVTQRITVLVRGLALGDADSKDARAMLNKEAVVGFLQGIALALIVGLGVALWQQNAWIGGIIAVAMLGNMVVAGLVGAAIPFILQRLKIDPALASAVIATTFTDCCGFAFSLGLATLLLDRIR